VLDNFFANVTVKPELQNEYNPIFVKCQEYLADKGGQDLEQYYDTLDVNQIHERCRILSLRVWISAFKEWHNGACVNRFDRLIGNAHCYSDITKTKHQWRVKILKDIADIYISNEIYPMIIKSYLRIIEECFSVYLVNNKKAYDVNIYDVNIVDRSTMAHYLDVTIDTLKQRKTKGRFMPEYLKIATYYCALGNYTSAQSYYALFDESQLSRFNNKFRNYYLFTKDVLQTHY